MLSGQEVDIFYLPVNSFWNRVEKYYCFYWRENKLTVLTQLLDFYVQIRIRLKKLLLSSVKQKFPLKSIRNQWECLIPILSHGYSHVLEHKWSWRIDWATSLVSKEGYLGNPLKQHDHFYTKIHNEQKIIRLDSLKK